MDFRMLCAGMQCGSGICARLGSGELAVPPFHESLGSKVMCIS